MGYTAKVGLRKPKPRPPIGLLQVLSPELASALVLVNRQQLAMNNQGAPGLWQDMGRGLPQETPDPTPNFDPRANLMASIEYVKRNYPPSD